MKRKRKDKKKKLSEKQEIENTASGKVLIRIYKSYGGNVKTLLDSFYAEEKRNNYGNLVCINEKEKFDESLEFQLDDVYREMSIILQLNKKSKEENLNILRDKIRKQEKLVRLLEKYLEINALYNFADESLKLRDLQIMYKNIESKTESGSFHTLENGFRVYSFESSDGFLIPVWHGADNYTQYPDHTQKKKIMQQEDIIFTREMEKYKRDAFIQSAIPVVLGMCIVAFVILLIFIFKAYDTWEASQEITVGNAIECAQITEQTNMNMVSLLNKACVSKYIDEKDAELAEEAKKESEQISTIDKLNNLLEKE